ncbi:hypothetical protein ACPCAC_07085 [Streptomyces lavendulocolor]|uniref:hypothetical protein n=1 Tax=Streptomyces lavendulocolor TaxID=67316 RepID=UPI003C2C9CF2
MVPRRPPANAVLGVPLSAVDRIRDLLPAGARVPAGTTLAVTAACLGAGWLIANRLRKGR